MYFYLDCPSGFKEWPKKLGDDMRDDSAIIFRNYEGDECAEICRESSGCMGYLYTVEMQLFSPKDSENGCWLYFMGKHGKGTRTITANTKEISCENINFQGTFPRYHEMIQF